MGEQNVFLGQTEEILGRFPLQIANNAAGHVLDIESALAQIGIVDLA